ncbi:MAG: sulfatase [Phycisphaerae bacterium]|nr:sulfatase [Phycisphaerae bacterium]
MSDSRSRGAMDRRGFIRGAGLAGAAAVAGRLPRCLAGAAAGKSARPNFLILLTDDQRADTLGCMGNRIIKTPNLDELGSQGVIFNNAFVTTSICMASRTSILTGQYERRHGCTFGTPPLTEKAMAQTYPALLRRAGYRTGFIGKFGVSVRNPRQYFDVWEGFGGQGKYEHKDEQGRPKHLTRIMGEQAESFLNGCRRDRPFCLSISFKAPHCQDGDPRQFIYDPAYKDLYKDAEIPVPKTATEAHFQKLPKFLQATEGRKRWEMRFATPAMFQESVKSYYRLVTGVDVVVGRIRERLEKLGLAENTVIVFTSDNGFYLGERGLAGKWYAHEESIRVPLIVYDPRMPASKRRRRVDPVALNIDLAPTILSIAGLGVPRGMQGRSLVPLLEGDRPAWRKDFFYEHLFERNNIPKSEGVRTDRWKYIRYFEQRPVYEELYDMQSDPLEERNLATDAAHRGKLGEMRKRCDELREMAKGGGGL